MDDKTGRIVSLGVHSRRVLVASAFVFALIAGGVAYGTIPDPGTGLIYSCYNKMTGALRVIDPSKGQKCASTETGLNWKKNALHWRGTWSSSTAYNVHDAVSLNGSSFIATAANTNSQPPSADWNLLASKGDQGDPGVSKGMSAATGTQVVLNSPTQTLTPVMSTPAAPTAGRYYINASIMLIVAQGDSVACILDTPSQGETGVFTTVGPVPNQTYETLPLAGEASLNAGDTATVLCTGYNANANTHFYDGGITATLINSDTAAAHPAPIAQPSLPPALSPKSGG
jgi:hypothetical protein